MIIFIDVDGTLVDYDNFLPETAVRSIQAARENGHKVYACTGRSKAEMYQDIIDIGFDGLICGNGCYIEENGEAIYSETLSTNDTKRIIDWLKSNGLDFYLESNSGLYASENFKTNCLSVMQEYINGKNVNNTEFTTMEEIFPELIYNANLYRNDLNKISFHLNSYNDYLEAKQKFADLSVNTWGGKDDKALFGDIGVKNTSKDKAVKVLMDYLNEPMENAISFGDANIDIPMFKVCAHSCCMGNGSIDAKKAAEYTTTSVKEDGLYNGFKHFEII